MNQKNQNQIQFETTIEKMNRLVKYIQHIHNCSRQEAKTKLINDLKKAGSQFDAEYAEANL